MSEDLPALLESASYNGTRALTTERLRAAAAELRQLRTLAERVAAHFEGTDAPLGQYAEYLIRRWRA